MEKGVVLHSVSDRVDKTQETLHHLGYHQFLLPSHNCMSPSNTYKRIGSENAAKMNVAVKL